MITLINARIPAHQDRQQIEINAAGKIERITEMERKTRGEKIIDMEGEPRPWRNFKNPSQ